LVQIGIIWANYFFVPNFLTDLNSTNGTYKNGVRLIANETVEIRPQDEIKLGNKIFYFN